MRFRITIKDGNGVPVDLTTGSLSVSDPSIEAYEEATISKVDLVNGIAEFMMHEDATANIPSGVMSGFRISYDDGNCSNVTGKIWVNLK